MNTGHGGMAKGKLGAFDTPEGFRRFLLTRGSATGEDVSNQLGLSRASYYRLVDMFVERLYGSHEPRLGRTKESTPPWFHEALLETVELHPDWGCYRLAEALSTIQQISGPTVQRELARLNLDTRDKRFAHKEKIILEKPGQFARLSEREWQQLTKNNPCLTDVTLIKRSPDTDLFAAQVLALTDTDGNTTRFLLLLVSLSTSLVSLDALNARASHDALREARSKASSIVANIPREMHRNSLVLIAIDSRKGILATDSFRNRNTRAPMISAISKRGAPATLKALTKRVKQGVVGRYLELENTEGKIAAKDYLSQWAYEYNCLPRLGFPTFGASPKDLMDELVHPEGS